MCIDSRRETNSNKVMKANAPEKIYIHPDIGSKEFIKPWLKRPFNENSIEYLRTDVFIGKALVWIKENIRPYYHEVKYKYEDFENCMKGE